MTHRQLFLATLALAACTASTVVAQAPSDGVAVTRQLWATTVTVRMTAPTKEAGEPADVTVFSGVSLGKGLIVTFSNSAPPTYRYRLTLPDGSQAEGNLRIRDLNSGLSLLEMSNQDVPGLALAEKVPSVGSRLYTAAAAGNDKPVVSGGFLGGVDRRYSGRRLPPLLQSDVRTTGTSPGAALVDGKARLVGIIAVNSTPSQGDGWTYAVPVEHVQYVQQAYKKEEDGFKNGKVELKILPERRPSLGMRVLTPRDRPQEVIVDQVVPGSPAEKAGIQKGDTLVAVDGRPVSKVVDVLAEVSKKQAGDRVELSTQRGGGRVTKRSVVLDRAADDGNRSSPGGVAIVRDPRGNYRIEPRNGATIPLAAGAEAPKGSIPHDPAGLREEELKRIHAALNLLYKQNLELQKQNNLLEKQVRELRQNQSQTPKATAGKGR